jgi:NADH-quinone oxidoreductase subunit A
VLGRKVRTKRKLSPYESGMPLLDDSHKRISVKFFIVAMMFILFDVEAAFLYPWAVVFREGGLAVFAEMLVFVVVLFLGYAYLWKKGAFDWS